MKNTKAAATIEKNAPAGNNANGRILLLHDDKNASHIWTYLLTQSGFQTIELSSPEAVLAASSKEPFDLILINFFHSWENAVSACRQLRAEVTNPILLVTAVTNDDNLLAGYAAGADECITKPITHRLFLAKIAVWVRRSWTVPTNALGKLESDALRLDPTSRQVIAAEGRRVRLTNLEFRVLHILMSHPGQTLETNFIVSRVWGHTGSGDNVLLKNVIYRLRRKIEADPSHPRYLQTMPGGGYAFHAD